MAVCCCSLAGTAACQHCRNNPMATDVWTNKTVTVDHVEAKPFGNGIDICHVCGKPSTIGKPITNADRIRAMNDYEMAEFLTGIMDCCGNDACGTFCPMWKCCNEGPDNVKDWLKSPAKEGGG